MTKRIFRSICMVAMGVFAASVALFMWVLYNYFSNVRKSQLKEQTYFVARAVANEGIRYFDGLDTAEYRITWVEEDGEVLYDNRWDSDEMENHLERAEIKEAFANGFGESSRYSVTLMERTLYCAMRLPDKTVIRLGVLQNTLLMLFLGMAQPVCMIIAIAFALSLLFAARLSKQIVKPLNELNLDAPLNNEGYDELFQLLYRIDSQQKQIKSQSDKLLQKQKEFDTVTENMTEGIILLNASGTVLGINRTATQLLGVGQACIGRHILSVSCSAELSELLRKAEKGLHAEKRINLGDNRYQMLLSPVISGGELSGFVLLAINITEKEKTEKMRREFTANVSHELKTPLHTIAGSAELLLNGIVQEKDRQDFYHRIYKEAQRMIRLVEDIIRLSHLDEGAEAMKSEEIDLYALAGETVQALLPEAKNMGIEISMDGEPAVISGIPQLIQSIIYNLCDNAVKYNRKGGRVFITVTNREDCAVIAVTDTGIGIPAEHQERIFERFYRVDKSRSKETGSTGLGLSIVKHAAGLHNANIELQSTADEGTTVTVIFPKLQKSS